MIVNILLVIIAYNAVFSDEQFPASACKEFEEIKFNNQCQNSCILGLIPRSDDCKRDNDCYSITCICEKLLCIKFTAVRSNGCKEKCKACLTDACNPLKLTEQPTTASTVTDGTQITSSTISSIADNQTRKSKPDTTSIDSTYSTSQSNGPMNDNNRNVAIRVAVGVAVGVVAAVALILIAAFLIFRHVRRRKRASTQGVTDVTVGYQYMTTVASTIPQVAPYDNLKPAPPGEQNPKPAQQTGSGFNNHFNGETGYDNAGGQIHHHYDEVRADDYSEITTHTDTSDVSESSARFGLFGAVAPPGESGETTLLDNEFYGDNASHVHSNNANEGETTVIDNEFYE